ncbi:MAG: hypothetical protein GF417_09430 [Candidatus Latescibacteria bacterium]|nr:hypothetical protein [Candidatus Latescibacterota bacterium]
MKLMNEEVLAHGEEEETVFDENQLLDKLGGDRDFYNEIIRDFVEDAERILSELEQAIAANDREKAERSAHSLKGSSANIGATALSRASLRVEKAVRERRMGAAGKLLCGMKDQFEKLKAALAEE